MSVRAHVAFVRECALLGFDTSHDADECVPLRATGMATFLRAIGSQHARLVAEHPEGTRDELGLEFAGEHWGEEPGEGVLLHEAAEPSRIRLSRASYASQPRDWRKALSGIAEAHRWALIDWSGEWDLGTLAFVHGGRARSGGLPGLAHDVRQPVVGQRSSRTQASMAPRRRSAQC